MAKHIGIRTLAEGVETEEQYAFLRDIGCEEVQGFYFSKPLPADEVLYVMHEKGIRFEEAEDKPFYLAAGRTEIRSDVPTVIYEWKNGRFNMLLANQSYRQLLEGQGWMLRWLMSPSMIQTVSSIIESTSALYAVQRTMFRIIIPSSMKALILQRTCLSSPGRKMP